MGFLVRRLTGDDAIALKALRLKALADVPLAFSESLEDAQALLDHDWQVRIAANSIFGLFDGDQLLGMAQIERPEDAALRHKAWLTSVYLDDALRGRGAGRQLLEHTIKGAKSDGILQLQLGVGEFNSGVKQLYERLGFETYGLEPRGLFANDEYVNEHLMVLFLDKETKHD